MKTLQVILILTVLGAAYTALVLLFIVPYLWVMYVIALVAAVCGGTAALTSGGTARFAEVSDMPHLLEGQGLILGHINGKYRFKDGVWQLFGRQPSRAVRRFLEACRRRHKWKLVRLTNAVHTAVFAPTGVGKGVSIVVPHLLTCRESMVVVDFKGENYLLTAAARRKMGHRVVCLDPFGIVRGTDTFNPLDFIHPTADNSLDESRALGNAIVFRQGTEAEPHWNDSAEAWISAFIALTVSEGEDDRSLQTIRPFLTNMTLMQKAIEIMKGSSAWSGMLARMGHQLTHAKEKELGSVLTTVNRHLRFLDTVKVAANTASSSFDPAQLCKGKMTVYLVIPPDHMREQSALLRMWIGSMLTACVKNGPQEKNKVHFILDEAASLGHMDAIDDAVDKYRGYGVRLLFLYQSLGQLAKCFPNGQEQTLLSNVSQVFFGVNDEKTADSVSKRLGEQTIWVSGCGSNRGWSHSGEPGKPYGYSGGESRDHKQQARCLLKPDEVMALDPRIAITFHPGVRPIATYLCRYYEGGFTPQEMSAFKAALDTVCLALTVGILCVGLTALAFF